MDDTKLLLDGLQVGGHGGKAATRGGGDGTPHILISLTDHCGVLRCLSR